jgi:hypothetical protein
LFKGFANVRLQDTMFEGGRFEDKFFFHTSYCIVLYKARQAVPEMLAIPPTQL